MLRLIATQNFSSDLKKIDQYLNGRVQQETWQEKPVLLNGLEYVIYDGIIAPLAVQLGWEIVTVSELSENQIT